MKRKQIELCIHIIAAIIFYILFSYSLFLGLQINPIYGNMGLLISGILCSIYIAIYYKYFKK